MARSGHKTVRFTQVVERSGEPHVHTLWLPPEKDPELQRAQKAHRVMTIESGGAGGKTDVGRVGFTSDAQRPAQFLIFPKSLKPFEGARVVGIKFDLVAQPKLAAVDPLEHANRTPARKVRNGYEAPPVRVKTTREAPEEVGRASEADDSRTFDATEPSRERAAAARELAPSKMAKRETIKTETAPVSKPSAPAKPGNAASAGARKSAATDARSSANLIREVRAAMKELERGKSVAAYQRLERAISAESRS